MGVVLVIFLGITVLWALITSLNAVIITARNCISLGSTEDFFSDIWKGSGGNLLTIVGVLILCVPLWLFLVIKIRLKKRHVSYRAETRYASNPHYQTAFNMLKDKSKTDRDSETVKQEAIQYLINHGESAGDAEESVSYYLMLIRLQQLGGSEEE